MKDRTVAPVAGVTRPLPIFSQRTEGFWHAAMEHELHIQACAACEQMHHPPVAVCRYCHGVTFEFRKVSGLGTVYSSCVIRRPRVPGLDGLVPYACVAVQLAEQADVLVLGNLVDCPLEEAAVGLHVEVCFEPLSEGLWLPQFRPAQEAS